MGAPLTGQGPHKADEAKTKAAEIASKPKGPPLAPPKRPSQPSQPIGQLQQPQPLAPQPQMVGLPTDDPALASLLIQALGLQRKVAQKFHLLVLPEDGWPTCEEFDEVQQLLDRIKGFIDQPVCLFAFMGHRLAITAGPHRYLHTPMGPLPLFDIPKPEQAAQAEYGWVGKPMDTPKPPQSDSENEIDDMDVDEPVDAPSLPSEDSHPSMHHQSVSETPIFSNSNPGNRGAGVSAEGMH